MKFTNLRVENYKALRDVEVPLSAFVCLIGENNVGKSSVLQALSLFFSGTALAKANYFDEANDIRIELSLSEIEDADLNRLAPEHREKIQGIIGNGCLTLVRIYGADGKSNLKYRRLYPREARFAEDRTGELLKGKKPGKVLLDSVVAQFPELHGIVTADMNQGNMRTAIERLADALPDDQKIAADADLPTGIDRSISAMLPERIYIPAVKNLGDDVKATESAPFGKVLRILLEAIEPQLAQERDLFEQLNAKLNKIVVNGEALDNRLRPVKEIEEVVQRFVQETFKTVTLRIEIPPPELKTVLSSALIYANDGVDGPIDSKGDGLRRAIVFAIIRSYVELSKVGVIPDGAGQPPGGPGYLLLFEEPELYLHPKAQDVLFDALRIFSQKHRVVVTTHSPLFFSPRATTTFIKMRKNSDSAVASKPFATASHVDLRNANERDQFQIICYENNNIAFFYETVVLVEGDSDYIALPHLARIINPAWDCRQVPVAFAKIGGKGNIRRYRDFFYRFRMHTLVITDLDFLLGPEFSQIDPSRELCARRDQLLVAIDAALEAEKRVPDLAARRVARAEERAQIRESWRIVGKLECLRRTGGAAAEDVDAAVNQSEAAEQEWARMDVLKNAQDAGVLEQKRALLETLRACDVYVLEKGTIDHYYPVGVTGSGKPARAQSFCSMIGTRDQAIALCCGGHRKMNGDPTSEFEAIFERVFRARP
jgi:putative ATP-dependent endonuclease of the OLD family